MTRNRSNWYRLATLAMLAAGCYDPESQAPGPSGSNVTKADQPGDASGLEGCEHDDECEDDELCSPERECVTDETGDGCDPAQQDCGAGFKCNPWAEDGGTSWSSSQCVPVVADPHAIGEACSTMGGTASGFDDCVTGSACIFEVCVELCSGAGDQPGCTSDETHCRSYNDGALALCEPVCDPLAQDCGVGSGCYYSDGAFSCFPEGDVGDGEVCEYLDACEAGHACMSADSVPCEGEYCCTSFCAIGGAACSPGLMCRSLFGSGAAPDGAESLGVCAI